jgi:hypothetical protein
MHAIPEPMPAPVAIDLTTQPFERNSERVIDPIVAAAETVPISTRGRVRISSVLPLPPTPATPTPFPAVSPAIAEAAVAEAAIAEPVRPRITDHVRVPRLRTTQILDRPVRHRYALLATIGGIFLMALLAFMLQRKSSTTPPPPRRDVTKSVQPAPPVHSAAPAQPPASTAPRTTVMLQVTSNPTGATVVLDGVRLGVTPFSAPVAIKTSDAWLKVRKQGYAAVKTRVSLDKDVTWEVNLHRLRGTSSVWLPQ